MISSSILKREDYQSCLAILTYFESCEEPGVLCISYMMRDNIPIHYKIHNSGCPFSLNSLILIKLCAGIPKTF